jgi:hypothetical protein
MPHEIRLALVVATALAAVTVNGARADEWCGYATKDNALVECGYTTVADCESAVGKGGMCFVDPDLARNFTLIKPASGTKAPTHG